MLIAGLPMASVIRSAPRQLPLPFEDLPLWTSASLEAALQHESGRPVRLMLTENRSVLLSFRRHHGLVHLRLHLRFFAGRLRVPITWGRGSGRARRGGLTFGSYDPVLALIRIHPVLDRRDVPLYFLESVIHHEMLHHHLGGVSDKAGRTVYH